MKSKIAFKIFIALCIAFINLNNISAQEQVQAATEEYKAENPGWLVNVDEAFAISQKTGKPILANFTGSDWCGWCKRLTASVFVHDSFKAWADKNVVLLELDFPRRKQLPENIKNQNYGLASAFQVGGYPTVWVFNLGFDKTTNQYSIDGIGKTGYRDNVDTFTNEVDTMIAAKKKGKS